MINEPRHQRSRRAFRPTSQTRSKVARGRTLNPTRTAARCAQSYLPANTRTRQHAPATPRLRLAQQTASRAQGGDRPAVAIARLAPLLQGYSPQLDTRRQRAVSRCVFDLRCLNACRRSVAGTRCAAERGCRRRCRVFLLSPSRCAACCLKSLDQLNRGSRISVASARETPR